ncbi:TadE/TadG family type IV pilus assembly protein [uncultured Enterovirga sp.]|uniref:TadE/TadG family type IV pilus assembly protein n=1 Tax=uncultured Enterovirga sp. TaxID=2026352 RepID=UPI0035CAB317
MRTELARHEGGAALIEAALLLPVMLLLLFGLIEISLYGWTSGLSAKAVQLGVRRAVLSDAVAVGPGLDPAESATYWDGLSPGRRCFPEPGGVSACPVFSVVCDVADGCRCTGSPCRFRFSAARLAPVLAAMRAVMPNLKLENIRVSYTTNGLGYVQRPVPVPVDVGVTLVRVAYRPLLLGQLLGDTLPIRASARQPGESLATR